MIDAKALENLVKEQIKQTVTEQFTNVDWHKEVEDEIIKYCENRILGKFNNSMFLPELVETVKKSVSELFSRGMIPGIETFVNKDLITSLVNQAVEQTIDTALAALEQDPAWLEKVETRVLQAQVQRTVAGLNSVDIKSVIVDRANEIFKTIDFSTPGIQDLAKNCQLTVLNDEVVVENKLTASEITAVNSISVKDLSVTGSINTDNRAWQELSKHLSQQAVAQITQDWQNKLVVATAKTITDQGINFKNVNIDGVALVSGNQLSNKITQSSLQTVGTLERLTVKNELYANDTLTVNNHRVGINTADPQMALTLWDEEVSISVGKFKQDVAYIGTNKPQGITFAINRQPAIEIDVAGLTKVKQLQLGINRIQFSDTLPNWSGAKGDIVFNNNPTVGNNIFAWVCLSGHKWKTIKSIE